MQEMEPKEKWLTNRQMFRARVWINGKPKDFYSKTSGLASSKAEEFQRSLEMLPPKVSSATVGGFIASQVAPLYAAKERATREQAAWGLGILIDGLGSIPVTQLTLGDCQTFMAKWSQGRRLWTVKGLKKYLFQTCRLLHRYGHTKFNYAEEIKVTAEPKERNVPTGQQGMRLWLANFDQVMGAPIFCYFVLGMDRSEALSITAQHIRKGALHVDGTKNGYRKRIIPLTQTMERILRHYLADQIYLCRGEDGQPLRHNFDRLMKAACRRADLDGFNIKSLRHAFGAIEYQVGCPRSIRKAILGQSNRADMGDVYCHPTPVVVRAWLEKWGRFLHLGLACSVYIGPGYPRRVRTVAPTGVLRAI